VVGGAGDLAEALTALTVLTTSSVGVLAPSTAVDPSPVRQARRNIVGDLAHAKTLRALARDAGLSPFHLHRLYLRCTGLTPVSSKCWRGFAKRGRYSAKGWR
jgi:AraC-like DNA-binding protein